MEDFWIVAGSAAFTWFTAGTFLALSSNRSRAPVAPDKREGIQIDRGLKEACKLISRFYIMQDLHIKITSAVVGYQTATINANIPARVGTAKILRTKQDLEHYLLASRIDLVPGSLKLAISGKMVISWGRKADKQVHLSKVYRRFRNTGGVIAGGKLPIGVNMDGEPFCVSLNSEESPHAMIVGSTGAGKTVAAMTIIIGALSSGWDVYILNPKIQPQKKKLGLWDFREFEGVTYITNYEDMVTAMTRLAHSMDRCERPVLVVADELADIIETKRAAIATPLGKISQKGREYDVHLVGITPKTTKSVLFDDMLHANASTTIIGTRTNTKYLSQYGTGVGGMNLDKLAGNGHAMVRTGSTTTEIQIALPDNIDVARNGGGVAHSVQVGLLSITERWLDSVPTGGNVSKDALRRFASNQGQGIGYDKVVQQYNLLVDRGLVSTKGDYQAGVKT